MILQEYTKAVKQLAKVRERAEQLRQKIIDINQRLQNSGRSRIAQVGICERAGAGSTVVATSVVY